MKGTMKTWGSLAIATTIALAAGQARAEIMLAFANTQGANVTFDGAGNFYFTPGGAANQLQLTGSSGLTGDSVGDLGYMSGSFAIGAITTVGTGESAPVTGTGTLVIHDGLGQDFTASLTWGTIYTKGTGGTINVDGILNLSSLAYAGTENDLLTLASYNLGTEVVTFSFTSPRTLTYLKANAASTSFAGTLSAVPEPTTVIAGAGALALMLLAGGMRKGSGVMHIG